MRQKSYLIARFALLLEIALFSHRVTAAQYDPPVSYYSTATGTGPSLKMQLHDIIDGHIARSYDAARIGLQVTDEDPNDPDSIILVYNRASLDVSDLFANGVAGWDNGVSWNREHTWVRAKGVLDSGPDNSDLHHLRPSDNGVNGDRDNTNFGGAFGQTFGEKTDKGSTVWYPGDADAGMIARQQFYMAVRYDGSDGSTTNLELVNGAPGTGGTTQGDLARLLEWHFQAVPDSFERRRNHAIYGLAGDDAPAISNPNRQENRNPFIDRPEYAWSIFVDQQNDSQLYFGAAPEVNGLSAVNLNLGSVLVGAAVPAAQNVTLNKNGLDGTYYEVTAAGSATSSVLGRLNAFPIITSGTGSRLLTVGLNTNTTGAGLRSGTVTVNNLDITSAGGSGKGANDGNDTINVSLNVLSHANPSFSLEIDQDSLTYDFGTVTLGSSVPAFQFDIANLVETAGFTAKLDLDLIIPSGDFATFSTDLVAFNGGTALEAGLLNSFVASIDTSAEGNFSALYTLNFSDEDLPGAGDLGSLTLNLSGIVEAATFIDSADFDDDGDVDGRDFLVWQRGFGIGSTLEMGDANNSGTVDGDDLLIWQEQYGQGPGESAAAQAVPEPTSAVRGLLWLASILGIRRRG